MGCLRGREREEAEAAEAGRGRLDDRAATAGVLGVTTRYGVLRILDERTLMSSGLAERRRRAPGDGGHGLLELDAPYRRREDGGVVVGGRGERVREIGDIGVVHGAEDLRQRERGQRGAEGADEEGRDQHAQS